MSSTALTELNKIEASLREAADPFRANSKLTSFVRRRALMLQPVTCTSAA